MRSTTAAADKTDKIALTLPRSIMQKIEKVRGDIPRSTYIEHFRIILNKEGHGE